MDDEVRRLTRSTSNRRIAGVCGGLAEYLNTDSTVVRLLFVIALLFASFGFWLYIVCWIVMPESDTFRN